MGRTLQVVPLLLLCFGSIVDARPLIRKPNIVYFLVDDLGFANVGYNNGHNPEPLTPNIDALHAAGAELTNFYTYRVCSPTRSSFMSGRLPHHVNQENHPPASPGGGVPLGMTTLANKLNASGYVSHMIGKWHCGMSCPAHLPINRGFSGSFGYLAGAEDHVQDTRNGYVDLWRNDQPAFGENGTQPNGMDYNTYKFTKEALRVIKDHQTDMPLFLYLAYQNVHGPLQAPANYSTLYEKIDFMPRRMTLAMITAVDDSIGRVVTSLQQKGPAFWSNTFVIFSSDNGGPTDHANNWYASIHISMCPDKCAYRPLRGGKGSDFEGGVRVCAFVSGGFLAPTLRGTKINGMMHITDWWATFSVLTGQNSSDATAAAAGLPPPDSINMWPMLSGVNGTSPRDTLVLRAIPMGPGSAAKDAAGGIIKMLPVPGTSTKARLKLVVGPQGGSYGGQYAPNSTKPQKLADCGVVGCLFNIDDDPTEHVDLATIPLYSTALGLLKAELKAATATYYQSPGSKLSDNTAIRYAKAHGDFWGPWLDGPYVPPPPVPPPPAGGFFLTKRVGASQLCLSVAALTKASLATFGPCDKRSHWAVSPTNGGLLNVAGTDKDTSFVRDSPKKGCVAGNTAQLGVAGGKGSIVTVFEQSVGILREQACDELCLGVVGTSSVRLVNCNSTEAQGWKREDPPRGKH